MSILKHIVYMQCILLYINEHSNSDAVIYVSYCLLRIHNCMYYKQCFSDNQMLQIIMLIR